MKTKFFNLLVALSLFGTSSLIVPQKADAAVGYLFKSKTLKSFGAITAKRVGKYGLTTFGIGAVGAIAAGAVHNEGIFYFSAIYGLINGYVALLGVGLGLIILDDNTVTGIDFLPIKNGSKIALKYTSEEVETYNSELDELNAIKDTLSEDLFEIKDYKDYGSKIWEDYSQVLSPATVKIAEDQAFEFVKKLK